MVPGAEARGLVAPRRAVCIVSRIRGWGAKWRRMEEEEHTTASLHGITTFPDHGADWSAAHVCFLLDNVYGE
jgi:hypothetical protein